MKSSDLFGPPDATVAGKQVLGVVTGKNAIQEAPDKPSKW